MITQNKFSSWLQDSVSESSDKKYRHRLLTEYSDKRDETLQELTAYVRSAHEDARRYLYELFSNTLDPFAGLAPLDPTEGYPELLHMQTLKGYFGEIFAGLIAEYFSPFGEDGWKVPVFLFRYHTVAFQELERIRQTGGEARQLPGRTGDDCLAFQLNSEGQIIRYLYCEAKCTSGGHRPEMVAEAHKKASESVVVDLQQVIRVLQQRNNEADKQWLLAVQKLSFVMRRHLPENLNYEIERCDMVSYICGKGPVKGGRSAWLPTTKPHEKYKAARRLETVEIHLPDIETLIRQVYDKKDNTENPVSIAYATED
jgi:hypothetical protein